MIFGMVLIIYDNYISIIQRMVKSMFIKIWLYNLDIEKI